MKESVKQTACKTRSGKVRAVPLGQHKYEIRRGTEVIALGFFRRQRTRSGAKAEAWIRSMDGSVIELRECYFADFMRWVKAYL